MSRTVQGEEHRGVSFLLAVLVHGVIAALLYFGVQWQTHQVAPVEVELWTPPPPTPEVTAPRLVTPPKPTVAPTPEPEPVQKPDIALDNVPPPKQVKVPPKPEEPPKPPKPTKLPEAVKPPPEPPKKVEPQKQTETKAPPKLNIDKSFTLDTKAFDASASLNKIAKQAQASEAGDKNDRFNQYIAQVRNLIKRNMVYSDDSDTNPRVIYRIRLLPDMTILKDQITLEKSSGNTAFDEAVKRAIIKTGQYPPIPPGAGFDISNVRNSTLKYGLHD